MELKGFYNMDCMEGMKEIPDKYFDLAIVDPPYGGGGEEDATETFNGAICGRFGGRFEKYIKESAETDIHFDNNEIKAERTGGAWASKYGNHIKHWDVAPPKKYFEELFRVSKNQIIWGGNYFGLPPTRCFLVWRKLTISEQFTMAMCEYAWTSFNKNAKWIEIAPQDKDRFHPTQKPVELYKWCLANYAEKGDKILDTHTGSASSLIACEDMGFEYLAFEIDPTYYKLAKERLDDFNAQMRMF